MLPRLAPCHTNYRSLQNIGRIWTDKTVSTNDIDISGAMSATVSKDDSDFITALSVLSSTSNIASTSTTPLDIVLVLDASGSMDDSMTGENASTR